MISESKIVSYWRKNRRLFYLSTIILLSSFLLTWLYLQTVAVSSENHFNYTKALRDLREEDAQTNSEVLANRLDITRNYDRLSLFINKANHSAFNIQTVPSFLQSIDRNRVAEKARELQKMQAKKSHIIEYFKSSNAILRNSLAYFAFAANAFLDKENISSKNKSVIEHYCRQVLSYARTPTPEYRAQVDIDRQKLVALNTKIENEKIANLLLHGDVIVKYLPQVNDQTQETLKLNMAGYLAELNHFYAEGYEHAEKTADQYRKLLYILSLFLTSYLAFVFVRLERARQSLAEAHEELSRRYAAQLLVEEQLRLHATVFHNAHDGIILADARGNILDVNPAFTRITGYERGEAMGKNPRILKSGYHDKAFYMTMWNSIINNGNWHGEIWNRNKRGEVYPELLSVSAVRNTEGSLTNIVAIFADISVLKEQEKQLIHLAYFDALTKLPNRVMLADRLNQGILQTKRNGLMLAVCFLDLDDFKPVNDTHGHEIGDQMLIEIAHRLQDSVRGGDTVARLGGDEFILLLLGLENTHECELAVQRILNFVSRPLFATPEPMTLSASIGVTLFPSDNVDPDTLIRHADQAMYQAKQTGRNRYHLFDCEFERNVSMRHGFLDRIEKGLENSEFVLYYQPKVNMREGTVTGAEALIRWYHPERGLVSPGEFIPFIEGHDLSIRIGEWVIETALNQLEEWQQNTLNITVNINVAGYHLLSFGFVHYLSQQLASRPHLAKNLEIEILESSALEDMTMVSRVIDACRELGVSFALDDFGTGYSSLAYLKKLPVSTIKIDQSFVRDMTCDPNDFIIVQGILGLANAFQRQVIAEGVETVEQGRMLMQLNCDHAQGYGISKPMPASDFPAWVASWSPYPEWAAIKNLLWDSADSSIFVTRIEFINWVSQLIDAITDDKPPPHQCVGDYRQCKFGIWYYGFATHKYQHISCFAAIEKPHMQIHEIASKIDFLWRNGQHDQAKILMNELLNQRNTVLEVLTKLENKLQRLIA